MPLEMPPSERVAAARAAATRFAFGQRPAHVADALRALADGAQLAEWDRYGAEGELALLEQEVAQLLGFPAAAFVPSGTMAQQAVLRVWSERTGHPAVAVHGLSHLVLHEEDAVQVVQGLRLEQLSADRRPLTADDLAAAPGPFAALVVELPLRDAGYLLPAWEELVALTGAARERGVPVHLDGARIWESGPHYADDGHDLAELAGLADSVYVSFYKGLGGVAGAALAGPEDVVAAVRQWRHRLGGTLFRMAPLVLSARQGLHEHLGAMAAWRDRARSLAAGLGRLDDVRVTPDPPHTNGMLLHVGVPPAALLTASVELAEAEGVWSVGYAGAAAVPGWSETELVVGPATMEWDEDELVGVLTGLVARARDLAG